MKRILRLLPLLAMLSAPLWAADTDDFAAVRLADQRRIVATLASDTATLATILSDDLLFAHSDGRIQTKAQFIAATAGRKVKYLSFVPRDIAFQPIVAGAVAMSGRALFAIEVEGRRLEFPLRFFAVWRKENDEWRLLAYQSSQLAEAPAAPAK